MKKRIGILLACFIMMSYLGVSPVLASISERFPNVDQSFIQMIITLPSLIAIPSSLIAGKLVSFIHKKTIILISMSLYVIAGIIPLINHEYVGILLFCAGLMGFGCGMMVTTTASIICDYFEDDQKNQMMGLQGASIALGGSLFTYLGGILSTYGWDKVYLQYLLVLPIIIVVIFTMPTGKLEVKEKNNTNEVKTKGHIPGYIIGLCTVGLLFYLFQNVYNTNTSLYVSEAGLGSNQTASYATMINSIAGVVAGVILAPLMKIFKKYILVFAFATSALGFVFAFFGMNMIWLIIGGALVGFAFSVYTPASTCVISDRVALAQRSMCIAILSACNNIGASISPIVVNPLAKLVGQTVRVRFAVSAVMLFVVVILACILVYVDFRKKKETV